MKHSSIYKPSFYLGISLMVTGVILGALGAHALQPYFTGTMQDSFETAVRYQLYHGLALLFIGILSLFSPSKWIKSSTYLFFIGVLLFSGSIYTMIAVRIQLDIGLGAFGLLTPLGGLLLIIAWLMTIPIINTLRK